LALNVHLEVTLSAAEAISKATNNRIEGFNSGGPMNADVLTTRVADGIAVITLGSARRIYFDAEMGDALTDALDGFAGDPKIRIVIATGGAPVISIVILISRRLSKSQYRCALPVASGPRTPHTMAVSSIKP
jgi:hypothetical protein